MQAIINKYDIRLEDDAYIIDNVDHIIPLIADLSQFKLSLVIDEDLTINVTHTPLRFIYSGDDDREIDLSPYRIYRVYELISEPRDVKFGHVHIAPEDLIGNMIESCDIMQSDEYYYVGKRKFTTLHNAKRHFKNKPAKRVTKKLIYTSELDEYYGRHSRVIIEDDNTNDADISRILANPHIRKLYLRIDGCTFSLYSCTIRSVSSLYAIPHSLELAEIVLRNRGKL